MLYFKYLSSRIVIGSLTLVVFLSLSMTSVMAKDITIQVWSGGTNVNDAYRIDAITMAADILEKEAAIRGEKLISESMVNTILMDGVVSNRLLL